MPMERVKKLCCALSITLLLTIGHYEGFSTSSCNEKRICVDNGLIQLCFDKHTGILVVFKDLIHNQDYLNEKEWAGGSPWEVSFIDLPGMEKVDVSAATDFSYERPDEQRLVLKWKSFKGPLHGEFAVTAYVTLEEHKPLSLWKIELDGTEGKKISKVTFPKITGIQDLGDERLAVPDWMGVLLEQPRAQLAAMKNNKRMTWTYPGHMSMQFLALYNPERTGFYASCNDTLSYNKEFSLSLDTSDNLVYQIDNFPPLDASLTSYITAYEAIVGSFKGDWVTAAAQYRDWASEQSWSKQSRLKNNLVPQWLKETAVWVWNRGESSNVLLPAVDLKNRLGLPVSVLWHWWHNESYDDSFPEYFPPREGAESFIRQVKQAQAHDVRSIIYMNQIKWGPSTASWETEHAARYAIKDIEGKEMSHVYNIFTQKALTNMCVATTFWKDKYASLVDSGVNSYFVNGVYMDQACQSRRCYDPTHHHAIGGGNYGLDHFSQLTRQIRQGLPKPNDITFSGEGVGENWLPHLDLFLALQVSKERYAGLQRGETIPLFQSVYHQYAITYGNYSSLLTPPYDEKWPEEFAPSNAETPLSPEFNDQFLMEQARSFAWGMQPMIANYQPFLANERAAEIDYLIKLAQVRQNGLKYLLYGKFLRAPEMEIPKKNLKISKLSIYAGQKDKVTTFEGQYPAVYTAAWQADDNDVGIALASISEEAFPVQFVLNSADYQLPASGDIYVIGANGRERLSSYTNNIIQVDFVLQPKDICILEIVPNQSL